MQITVMTVVHTGKIVILFPFIPTVFIEYDKNVQKCVIYKLSIVFRALHSPFCANEHTGILMYILHRLVFSGN